MLSRWLTLGLSLLVGSLCGCENQGLGTRVDAIEQICAYNVEAIQQIPCMNETIEKEPPSSKADYFKAVCVNQNRIVAPRCGVEQRALADCMVAAFTSTANAEERTAVFRGSFACEWAAVTWPTATAAYGKTPPPDDKAGTMKNGNAIIGITNDPGRELLPKTTAEACKTQLAALTTCSSNPPSYAP